MKYLNKVLTPLHQPLIDFILNNRDEMGTSLVSIGCTCEEPSLNWMNFYTKDLGFKKVLIIEAYEPYFVRAQKIYANNPNIIVVYNSIQEAIEKNIWNNYDTCFWCHGPEHMSIEDHKIVLPKLFNKLNKLFLGWCPWGNYYGDGKHHANSWQEHKIVDPTPEIFKDLNIGLQAGICGQKDTMDGTLFVYRWINKNV